MIIILGIILLLINCFLFFISMSKKAKTYKVFAFYLLIMAIIQIASLVTSKLKIHNIFLTHFYFQLLPTFFEINISKVLYNLNPTILKVIKILFSYNRLTFLFEKFGCCKIFF